MKRLLAKDRNSVGLEAHEQLVTQTAELQKEGDTLRGQGKQVTPACGPCIAPFTLLIHRLRCYTFHASALATYFPHHATPPLPRYVPLPRYAPLPRYTAPQAAAAKEKLETDLAASVQLVGKLKKAGGNFKAQLAAATKELDELRGTAAAEKAKGQSATELETQLAAAKAAADEGEKKAAALGAQLEQARTLQPYAVEAATVCGRGCNRILSRLQPYVSAL